jgi:hypothetical protein
MSDLSSEEEGGSEWCCYVGGPRCMETGKICFNVGCEAVICNRCYASEIWRQQLLINNKRTAGAFELNEVLQGIELLEAIALAPGAELEKEEAPRKLETLSIPPPSEPKALVVPLAPLLLINEAGTKGAAPAESDEDRKSCKGANGAATAERR